jgi:hypothetical protein
LLVLTSLAPAALLADFLRGDANQDGKVDVSDAVTLVRSLFHAGEPLTCEDAADSNDDGKLNVEDAISTLVYLFAEGGIPNPGPLVSGPDPTCDLLDCGSSPALTPSVVLSEIQYNPKGDLQSLEYVELHNRTAGDVSLASYRFTKGIDFQFPADAVLPAGGYALVLKSPTNAKWRRTPGLKVGPFEGGLSNGGERLTLTNGDCDGESVKYGDRVPWPIGPDGGGPSLERVDELTPADDYHAWRTSTSIQGTPGEANSTAGTPARPVIVGASFEPAHPTSKDAVLVKVKLDSPPSSVRLATLHWEAAASSLSAPAAVEMALQGGGEDFSLFSAQLPPAASQTLIRMDLEVELADGRNVLLPPPGEPKAFLSYFVYDGEMAAKLPILWFFQKRRTGLPIPARSVSGVVILEPSPEGSRPLVLDGADVRGSRQGAKIKFLKGEEYRGDRTLNMTPEEGGGGTGNLAPHMEHLGFETFRDLGAIAPRADWFRVVDLGSAGKRNTQRLLIQEVNERFLEMNGLNPSGDLYKYVYQGLEKHTNIEVGMKSFNDLVTKLRSANALVRSAAVQNELDTENVGLYSMVNVLIANWDGFHNNMYIYNDLSPGGRWKIIPWDLDQVFEVSCAQMPVTRPITGEGCNSREPGVISRPYHLEPDLDAAYRDGMKVRIAPGGAFSREAALARIDAIEALLLDDLALQEAYLGVQRAARRSQIKSSYSTMRAYVERRIPYLKGVLEN